MGIQRFGSRMKDYATHVTLGKTGSADQSSTAIIDGPGLAHYIYHGLCDSEFAPVTYRNCADATIQWLKNLEQYGFTIDSIFFDGVLPPSKKDVRIDRIQNCICRLQTFQQSSDSSLSKLNCQGRKSLPPPPFLVFAIVEELLQSKYASVTYVVPGEADPYCAAAAQALSAETPLIIIFSDDSDLIVYRASKNCRIAPFRDLSESKTETGSVLSGDVYNTYEIVSKCQVEIEDLVKPADFMYLDHHCSLEKAFRLTKSSNPETREEFQEFAKLYAASAEMSRLVEIRATPALKNSMALRDSRVSELVYQVKSGGQGGTRIYLPFISEDPTRASVWTVGIETRLLAYSALLKAYCLEAGIQEYKRSWTRVASSLLEPLSSPKSDSLAHALERSINQSKEVPALDGRLRGVMCWRYLAMQQTLHQIQGEGHRLPGLDDVVHIIMNREPRKWHLLHLGAQYQAAYYSLRLLKQVLADDTVQESASLTALHAQLIEHPTISTFFDDCAGTDRRQEQDMWRQVLQELLGSISTESSQGQHTRSRPKKKAKEQKKASSNDRHLGQNRFAVLAGRPIREHSVQK